MFGQVGAGRAAPPSRASKYVLNTLMQAFQLPSLARAVAESTLRELTGELLYRLLDDRIPRVSCLLYSDANRDVRGFGWEIAHAAVTRRIADYPLHDGTAMVLRTGGYTTLGFEICPSFKAIFCRAVPNLGVTIRNCCIAVRCLRPPPPHSAASSLSLTSPGSLTAERDLSRNGVREAPWPPATSSEMSRGAKPKTLTPQPSGPTRR